MHETAEQIKIDQTEQTFSWCLVAEAVPMEIGRLGRSGSYTPCPALKIEGRSNEKQA
ncbi:hypothetical protein [Oceanobacillus locisalsi]|uniref:Uncharacterized protein n=1 Tax=Oceanobacillus locisalsi TaxID=546107 RepID=A0ABW3NDQ8_9BACI